LFKESVNRAIIIGQVEGHFFDRSENFNGMKPVTSALDAYHNSFSVDIDTKICCDVTPDYVYRQDAVQRVFNYNPNAIWIIFLRNPVDRAYSAWNMEVNREAETLSFEDALKSEINGNPGSRSHDRFHYLARSRYIPQLENLWEYFPQSQCQIYSAESIWQRPQVVLNRISKSLSVDTNITIEYDHVHKGTYVSDLSAKARGILTTYLSSELSELPALLGWRNNPWTSP